MQLADLQQELLALQTWTDRPAAGLRLEKFLNTLFCLSGLQPRSPFRVTGEQIDGSFELDFETYLLEAKWEKDALQAKELYAFREVIEGKSAFHPRPVRRDERHHRASPGSHHHWQAADVLRGHRP